MNPIENATVAEIAASSLAAVRVFEKYGIDYCCGGKRPLEAACRQKGHDAVRIKDELEAALRDSPPPEHDWPTAPLADLCSHIVAAHHGYLKRELPALQQRLDKVYRVYNERYPPALIGLPEAFAELRKELEPHLQKEENVLFPAISAIAEAARTHRTAPKVIFGSITTPIGWMEAEHEHAGKALRKIRKITNDFGVPDYACVTYKALMHGLAELEQDLHLHIHLENNVLFPRVAELEAALSRSRSKS